MTQTNNMAQIVQVKYKGDVIASSPRDNLLHYKRMKSEKRDYYFLPSTVKLDPFEISDTRIDCPWKGRAVWYNYKDGKDVAWSFPHPNPGYEEVKGRVAFCVGTVEGVTLEDLDG